MVFTKYPSTLFTAKAFIAQQLWCFKPQRHNAKQSLSYVSRFYFLKVSVEAILLVFTRNCVKISS